MPKRGDIFEIAIAEGIVAFAQALNEPEYAFFAENPMVARINEPLFRIWVHKSAPRSWRKLGNSEPNAGLNGEIPRFKKDPITGALSTYIDEVESPASSEEVEKIECAAVWEEQHIVERLADQLAGRSNKWVESLKP